MTDRVRFAVLLGSLSLLAACGDTDDDARPFGLRFVAMANGQDVGCGDTMTALGTHGTASASLADLRFYISNLRAYDTADNEVAVTLDSNDFQYASTVGQVSLIDLTGNAGGACDASAIAFAEGTARTNTSITGNAKLDDVARIGFDVGVPQALMRDVIANSTAEGAPSPLAEMYWSWQTGYRHFVMNMAVEDTGGAGEAYIHVGSRDCGAGGQKALTDRDACTFVNTPHVELAVAGLRDRTITVDIPTLLSHVGFVTPVMDESFQVIGTTVGAACHSSPMQSDCAAIFPELGLSLDTGDADASANLVFGAQ